MKILCITHADFEQPGTIQDWALKNNHIFTIKKPYLNEQILFDQLDFEFLIIMGGPQSASDHVKYPYLKQEIDLIKKSITSGKKILGICLGAQLIGEALGCKTEKSPAKEIGVFHIIMNKHAAQDALFFDFPASLPVLHWHGDMPGINLDSIILASSLGCPRQIIRYSDKVYGFQCHLEIDRSGLEALIHAVPEDLLPDKYVQNIDQLNAHDYSVMNYMITKILDRFVSL